MSVPGSPVVGPVQHRVLFDSSVKHVKITVIVFGSCSHLLGFAGARGCYGTNASV